MATITIRSEFAHLAAEQVEKGANRARRQAVADRKVQLAVQLIADAAIVKLANDEALTDEECAAMNGEVWVPVAEEVIEDAPEAGKCECGCGQAAARRFVRGHASKARSAARKAAAGPVEVKHCECGCGAEVTRRFVRGHDSKLHSAQLAAVRDANPVLCGCGCGGRPTLGRNWLKGHASKAKATARRAEVVLCACGCGSQVSLGRTWARGHASAFRAAQRKAELVAA